MLTKEQIKNFSKYYQHRLFQSEQEAREQFAKNLRRDNDLYGAFFGRTSEQDIIAMSLEIPVYKLKKFYKIGNKIRPKSKRFSWKNVDIEKTYLYELDGLADTIRDRLGPVKMVRVSSLFPIESHATTESGE